MQRRATALYVAFFFLVGAASYALIATADGASQTHISGLWGVTILCGAVVILLSGLAYMPSRY